MPGLSQLKQFNKDVLSLGDEVNVRSQRGEKPVRVAIPSSIQDINDSEDFIMGMPEIEALPKNDTLDDDLSDLSEITGGTKQDDEKPDGGQPEPSYVAPDLSTLLSPMPPADGDDDGMPDLSAFMEPEEEEVIEEEPEETSIADMDLEALLGGAGFDGSTGEDFLKDNKQTTIDDDDEDYYSGGFGDENYNPKKRDDENQESDADALSVLADLGIGDDTSTSDSGSGLDLPDLGDLGLDDLDGLDDLGDTSLPEETVPEIEDIPTETPVETPAAPDTPADDLGLGDLGDLGEFVTFEDSTPEAAPADDLGDLGDLATFDETPVETPAPATPAQSDDLGLGDLGDLGEFVTFEDSTPEAAPADDLGDLGDLATFDETPVETPAPPAQSDDLGLGDLGDLGEFVTFEDSTPEAAPADDLGDLGDLATFDETPVETPAPAPAQSDDLGLGDLGDLGEFVTFEDSTPETAPADDLGDLGDLATFDETPVETPAPAAPAQSDDLGLGDLGDLGEFVTFEDSTPEATPADDLGDLGDLATFDETPVETPAPATPAQSDDLGLGDLGDLGEFVTFDDSTPDVAPADTPELNDGFGSDFGAAEGLDALVFGADSFESVNPIESIEPIEPMEEIEDFDTSGMDGIDFDTMDTGSQMNEGSPSEFELGDDQDFILEGHEFEIPGFSDVTTAKEESRSPSLLAAKGKSKNPDEEELPPNTLSDSQYKQFLKNLNEYPLNVRLAFEDLLVKNEFTDDAEFEVVEKILNKSSARSVASTLEKMLDISIPVPRDYEHRTAEEYEAYKKSLQYQLKNKIIPAVFVCMIMLVVGFGLFQFGKNCIYIPAKANSLYKQGYAMLEADEYPQSEIRFNEATKYRLSKKWFFKYAHGYHAHKQYLRAEWMYQNILKHFKHDKAAGLEYAAMELNDLANYEKAEEICRREILDYHINDADGILLLGDIFLEWGTEKDPEMLEKAREQYATLIQLYKPNLLYQARMMRYFIRTDNFRNVLQLKELFIPKEKNLSAEDWAELAGYMLDKLYGPLAPSDEYLRTEIEDVRLMLMRAVKLDPKNPIASYNLARYFIETNESNAAKETLSLTINNFKNSAQLHKRDIYKYIDSYRLIGEQYSDVQEYLRAQEYYTEGISLYTAERDASGFEGNKQIGVLFEDQANIDYFVSGDFDNALRNYVSSVELENDTPSIRYRIGYIQYKKKNYSEALGSFMKAGDGNIKETNLMLAMANTLSLRGDNYAAQGYYEDLISNLDREIAEKGIVLPQTSQDDYDLVETYLHAANNYGVTLYRLASRTGNSSFNAEAIVQMSQSVRAWDALTRNQDTLVRLGGSNLAEENIKYITHPVPDFEPAIYTEIPRILAGTERF